MKLSKYLHFPAWQILHVYFFNLFLLSIPFQTRKVFLTQYSFYTGAFTEYSTYYLYASDIFLILTIISWLLFDPKIKYRISNIIIRARIYIISRSISNIIYAFKQAISEKKYSGNLQICLFLLGLFNFWLFIDLFIHPDYFEISLYQNIKMFEFSFLFLYVILNLRSTKRLVSSLKFIALSGIIQSLVGILQFLNQHSIFNSSFFQKFTGEPIISNKMLGSAKIIFEDEKILRAYGTLPHPNILAGFLIFTIFITIYLYIQHKSCNMSILSTKHEYRNTLYVFCQGFIAHFPWIASISLQVIALILTFSRSAWLAFCISAIILFATSISYRSIVSRETISFESIIHSLYGTLNNPRFNIYHGLCSISLIIGFVVIVYFPYFNSRFTENLINTNSYFPSNYAVNDRLFFNNVSRETISANILTGSGLGTSIFQINSYLTKNAINKKLQYWQYQPDHNTYFLIVSEIGIIGMVLLLLLILNLNRISQLTLYFRFTDLNKSISNVSRETFCIRYGLWKVFLASIILSILITSIFDHYYWTIQQGRIIFWIVLGLIAATAKTDSLEV